MDLIEGDWRNIYRLPTKLPYVQRPNDYDGGDLIADLTIDWGDEGGTTTLASLELPEE